MDESVLIFRDGNNVLNSKSEFNRCQVPRLSVMIGDQSNVAHPPSEEIKPKKRSNVVFLPPSKRQKSRHLVDKVEESQIIDDSANSLTASNDDRNVNDSSFPNNNLKIEAPKPTKKQAKVKVDLKGQPKIFSFFQQTTNGKPVLQNLPAPPPT